MPFLEWNQDFSVDEPKLDDQHQQWIDYLNALHAAVLDGPIDDTQREILENLVIYTRYHFASEESYLNRVGYPQLEEHRQAHIELVSQLLARQKAIAAGESELYLEFLTWFRAWIVDHIVQEDMKYVNHLTSQAAPALVLVP